MTQPRPDPNAPRKPKPAYVLFGEHVRQDPVLSHAPHADIERAIERRWKALSQEERANKWEAPVLHRQRSYQEALERYKYTENYQTYQIYLEAFTQRQGSPTTRTIPETKARSISDPAPFTLQQEDPDGDQEMILDAYDFGLEGQPHDATSPVKCGMTEVRVVSRALGVNPHLMRVAAYPSEDATTNAVEDFLNGTGALIYLWDREEAVAITKSVYHPQNDDTPLHATEVFAMAAVGSYCDGETGKSFYQERFLEFFLCLLSSPSAMCDLRRMRLFACLAICRFTNNVLSARTLMCELLNNLKYIHDRLTV